MRRTQIYLDDEQDRLLAERAHDLGATKSELIRDAIDRYLGRGGHDADERTTSWQAALDATFGIAPGLPPGATYVAELRAADARRTDPRRSA